MSFIVTTETPSNAHINSATIYLEFLIITTTTFKFLSVSYSSKGSTMKRTSERERERERLRLRMSISNNWQKKKGRLKEREVVISANCNDNISFCDYTIFNISMWHCQGDAVFSVVRINLIWNMVRNLRLFYKMYRLQFGWNLAQADEREQQCYVMSKCQ